MCKEVSSRYAEGENWARSQGRTKVVNGERRPMGKINTQGLWRDQMWPVARYRLRRKGMKTRRWMRATFSSTTREELGNKGRLKDEARYFLRLVQSIHGHSASHRLWGRVLRICTVSLGTYEIISVDSDPVRFPSPNNNDIDGSLKDPTQRVTRGNSPDIVGYLLFSQ